jgi:hypothetical protein
MMQDALAAQQKFRYEIAGPLYEEVVARAPLTFDAVHMLGVVRLLEQDFDAAESLLTRAQELSPADPSVRFNLALLASQSDSHARRHSSHGIVATDMLRLLAARGALVAPAAADGDPFAPAAGIVHVVVPGKAASAASNRTGRALARRLGPGATLWAGPGADRRIAEAQGARVCASAATGASAGSAASDPASAPETERPEGGRLIVLGLDEALAAWLAPMAESFDSIVVALDAHDPVALIELAGRLSPPALRRLRFAARSRAVLDECGLPGVVDPLLFDDAELPHPGVRGDLSPRAAALPRDTQRLRLAIFMPALRDNRDRERWALVEGLRVQPTFIRLLHPGQLPSPHRANVDEHLVGLASEWDGWWEGLDALLYWGVEGALRQYDRLVHEALRQGLAIVADGFGDYGDQLAARDDCAQFFDAAGARRGLLAMFGRHAIALRAEGASKQ